ncbi:MAG TPA: hypothetical protein VF103_15710 [Polyangiaceae bacterium]
MGKSSLVSTAFVCLGALLSACGSDGDSSDAGSGGSSSGGSSGAGGNDVCAELPATIDAYRTAHPGVDADINQKTPSELAADPDAQGLMALCGADQRPVIPKLAWEYGGSDHAWINPEESALGYCVYTPVNPATEHWSYDAADDHVEADVSVICPERNPCNDEAGADVVMACLGDDTNVEILVDTASFNDGEDVGLSLSEASTDLYLVAPGGDRVHLYTGL